MKSRSQGLRRILDDDKFPPACDRSEPIHVAEPAIQVNRNDRPRPRSNCPFKGLHVHIEVVADVDQNRSRANVHYRGDRGRERMSDRNYLITSSDASRDQGKVQGVISTVDANRVADTDIVGQMTLEAAELVSKDEITPPQRVRERVIYLGLQPAIVLTRINERYSKSHAASPLTRTLRVSSRAPPLTARTRRACTPDFLRWLGTRR